MKIYRDSRRLPLALLTVPLGVAVFFLAGCAGTPAQAPARIPPVSAAPAPPAPPAPSPPRQTMQESAAAPAPAEMKQLALSWDYGTNGVTTNLVFMLYQSGDVSVPLTNWVPYMEIPVTDYLTNGAYTMPVVGTNYVFTFAFSMDASREQFWYVTARNSWGESNPSNVLATDPAVRPAENMRLVVKIP